MLTINPFVIKRKVIILQKGFPSVAALAKKIGHSRPGVGKVINGKFKSVDQSAAMLDAIVNELDVEKETFWPEFYGMCETGDSENIQRNVPKCF